MKLKYFFAALSIVALAAGCVKETSAGLETDSTPTSAPERGKEGYVELTLSTKSLQAKTAISGRTVNWEQTDLLSVFSTSATNYEFSVLSIDGPVASFLGTVSPDDAAASTFVAVYPYNADYALTGNILSGIEVKTQQPLVAGTFAQGMNLSLANAGANELVFRNLCALVRVPVSGPVNVKKIVITAPDGTALAGKGTADVSSQTPSLTVTEGASNVVTLVADTPVSAAGGVDFYAVVAPQAAEASYEIEVILEDGTSMSQTLTASLTRSGLKAAQEMKAFDGPVYYGSSNCYLAKEGQTVEFGVEAHYATDWGKTAGTCSPTDNPAFAAKVASADIHWKENTLTSISASYADGKVTVSEIAGTGNALVAIKDAEGAILWSYHIWVPVADPTQTLTYPMSSDYSKVASYQVMPMALGAMNTSGADAAGLFYQWGRKDPLGRADLTSVERNADGDVTYVPYVPSTVDWETETVVRTGISTVPAVIYDYSVKNPTKFISNQFTWKAELELYGLWGNPSRGKAVETFTKSIYDPCPAGYKVAPYELFSNFIKDGGVKTGLWENSDPQYFNVSNLETCASDLGYWFYYDEDKTDFYPFTGLLYFTPDDGKIVNGGVQGFVYASTASIKNNNTAYQLQYQIDSEVAGLTAKVLPYQETFLPAGKPVRCIKE